MNCKVVARATVNPTEDLDKIIESLSNVFHYADIVIGEDSVTVTGDTSCLVPFKEFLEKRKIRETARKMILKGWSEDSKVITLKLSKQAAFAGMVNLVEDDLSPWERLKLR